LGPGAWTPVSKLRLFGTEIELSKDVGGGGGSITDEAGEGFVKGSGREGIGSSEDDVSMVMCLVTGGLCLSVYTTGEHLTATDGFLWPGRCAMGGLLIPPRV
jgi:hypothetical protein